MTNDIVPMPAAAESDQTGGAETVKQQDANGRQQDQGGGSRKPSIPDPNACLAALAQMPGMVAFKLITPAQSNAMRAPLEAILRQHNWTATRAGQSEGRIANVDLMELARRNPEVLNMLAPVLTEEQITMVMKTTTDGSHGKT
jgi:hypothetical protein